MVDSRTESVYGDRMTDEDHGPLFSGNEEDLYRIAFENVNASVKADEELVAVYCENCGEPSDEMERCETCLFYYCEKCQFGPEHTEMHLMRIRHEERS